MRLSEWRKTAPSKESLSNRVLTVLRPLLVDLGAESDAECWVAWGEDPEYRYSVLAPALAGLISVAVRLGAPDEDPRATARLIRWSKVSVTELSVEASGGHRMVAVQVESLVLKGIDAEADRICEFVRGLIASVEDRNPQAIPIAVVQGVAAGRGAAVALPDSAESVVADETGLELVSEPGAASSKRAAPKAAPRPSKAAAKASPSAAKPPASVASADSGGTAPAAEAVPGTLVPFPAPASDAASVPPMPLASRTAAARQGDKPGVAHPTPGQSEPEAEPPAWVGPHPIEESPVRDPNRPRPWKP